MKLFKGSRTDYNGHRFEFKVGFGHIPSGIKRYKVWTFKITLKFNYTKYYVGVMKEIDWPKLPQNYVYEGEEE